VASLGGDVTQFVSPYIKTCIQQKIQTI